MLRRSRLQARTALKAHKALERHKALDPVGRRRREKAQAQGKPVKPALASRYRDTGPDQLTIAAILERAQHSCERCSEAVGPVRGADWHCHHRRPRGSGGTLRADTNFPSNCTVLCPRCHDEIESYRATAMREGWLLQQDSDPARVPLLIERGARWVYLTAKARYATTPPDEPVATVVAPGEEL